MNPNRIQRRYLGSILLPVTVDDDDDDDDDGLVAGLVQI